MNTHDATAQHIIPPGGMNAAPAAYWRVTRDMFVELFEQLHADDVSIWQRYPDVTEAEDARTDTMACEGMSTAFADLLLQYEANHVALVYADNADASLVGSHVWVRFGRWNVDWTARQYFNLEHPHNPEHADLPCPLMWEGDGHPVVAFRSFEVISQNRPTPPAMGAPGG